MELYEVFLLFFDIDGPQGLAKIVGVQLKLHNNVGSLKMMLPAL